MQRFDTHSLDPGTRQRTARPCSGISHACMLMMLGSILAAPAGAQSGGGYDLARNTIDGGGATFTSGGIFQLGGTIGQPDAGALSGGAYSLSGGFWGSGVSEPTATPTSIASPTATGTPAPTATPTNAGTTTPAATPTMTRSATPLSPHTPTLTATRSPVPTVTATRAPCVGDCDHNHVVTVDELLTMVHIALGKAPIGDCTAGDFRNYGAITVDEILAAVNKALAGCP